MERGVDLLGSRLCKYVALVMASAHRDGGSPLLVVMHLNPKPKTLKTSIQIKTFVVSIALALILLRQQYLHFFVAYESIFCTKYYINRESKHHPLDNE